MEYKILFKISLGIRRDRSLYVKFKIQEFLNNWNERYRIYVKS